MITQEILIAGFGGQGIQFSGKLLAHIGLIMGRELSLMPSYGPETRGGTSTCGVMISQQPIASPVVSAPNVLITMNSPSFDRFNSSVVPGGSAYIDTTLITAPQASLRGDVTYYALPYTGIAKEHDYGKLTNMIIIGKYIKESNLCDIGVLKQAMEHLVSAKRPDMIDINMKALNIGMQL